MSIDSIVELAERIVNGYEVRVPALNMGDWKQLWWWVKYYKANTI